MKFRVPAILGVLVSTLLTAQHLHAGDMHILMFYGAAPVSGSEVSLDGEVIGTTDQSGAFDSSVSEGPHRISIGAGGAELAAFDFVLEEGQNIDIKVDIGGTGEPTITLDTYRTDDADAPKGMLSGIVVDMSGRPVPDARVSVEGLDLETLTDSAGEYEMTVPRGIHFVGASHPEEGSSPDTEVRILAGAGVDLTLQLRRRIEFADPPTLRMEESVVVGQVYNPNPIDTISMEREALTVTDALDLVQLERFADSDVASAVRRLVGVAVEEGKYAIIRGLDGRYIASTINAFNMPSTDALRRDLELDLFPADILGGIEVQKGYTADQPGDSSAGTLRVRTRDVPENRVFNLSVSGGFREDITGEHVPNYEGDTTDDLGFDDGFRGVPPGTQELADAAAQGSPVDLSVEDRVGLAQSLTNVYNTDLERAVPPFGLGAAYGNLHTLDSGDFGYYAAYNWGFDTSVRLDSRTRNTTDLTTDSRVEKSYDMNAYLALSFDSENMSLDSKSMWIRQTVDRTSNSLTVDGSDDNREFDETILEWTEREFIAQQFSGEHFFADGDHRLDWALSFSQSSRYQPDRRFYTYDSRPSVTSNDGLLLSGEVERRWNDLTDEGLAYSLDYRTSFEFGENIYTDVQIGALYNEIERDVDLIRLVMEADGGDVVERLWNVSFLTELDPETIFIGDNLAVLDDGEPDIFVDFRTESTGNYNSTAETTAFYIQTDMEIGDFWTVGLGVRHEEYTQSLAYPNDAALTASLLDLDSSELLPALSVNYQPNDNWIFRLGYSSTLSYPGLTERSESITYDPDTDNPIFGNPDLQVSELDNIDFRAEYYFNTDSSISLALFYKDIENPIEKAVADSVAGVDSFTYRNNEAAEVRGVEIDANIRLFDGLDWDGFLAGNLAFTSSEVTLDADSLRLEADPARELQGLSPVLANIQFGADHIGSAISGTLLVNYFDDRIDRVERSSLLGPIFEMARVEVDLNFEWESEFGTTVSFQIRNVLDSDIEFRGESVGGVVFYDQSYRQGREFSIGVSQSF